MYRGVLLPHAHQPLRETCSETSRGHEAFYLGQQPPSNSSEEEKDGRPQVIFQRSVKRQALGWAHAPAVYPGTLCTTTRRRSWPEGPGCDFVNLVSDSSRHLATLLSCCLLVVVVIISHHLRKPPNVCYRPNANAVQSVRPYEPFPCFLVVTENSASHQPKDAKE
ncbi:hypothetical protein VTJ04DRAFT_4477 [Mycothermus thermophilus]|uniref:uncharacterized protein n=1 Tax=Humicola insolens TaxID=85995 RepID=UPI0037423798